MIRLGLIVNPLAGIGGAVGLKGSDGAATVSRALALGAEKKAGLRTLQALKLLVPLQEQCEFVTCPGEMGAIWLEQAGLSCTVLDLTLVAANQTCREDTLEAARLMLKEALDVLLFAGGDGTARDICSVVDNTLPVLGIPAGVKIHSGVYGITPVASAEVICQLVKGGLVDIRESEVRDLDEDAFRRGVVRARHYGDMRVPAVGHFIQAVKQGGAEVEELVLADIAATLQQEMEDGCLYLMGGQGHIIGRGNQQFSVTVLTRIGRDNINLVSTKTKITALAGRPLVIDSGDSRFDTDWAGTMEILTGYQERILYAVGVKGTSIKGCTRNDGD